jgi:integrase
VHARGLRHTHGAELAAGSVPVSLISRQPGHANSAVTARYIDHIAWREVIAAMRARTWTESGHWVRQSARTVLCRPNTRLRG